MNIKYIVSIISFLIIISPLNSFSEVPRSVMNLNGNWEFEQTEKAFPPEKFSRIIQVPGLIDLAVPKIEQYKEYFSGRQKPRYSWYRYRVYSDSYFP